MFDGYLFQAVECKARFIAQVMRGRLDVRELDDIGNAVHSYNEVKALATGNPLLMDKAEATRLHRAERAHHRNQDALVTRSPRLASGPAVRAYADLVGDHGRHRSPRANRSR